MRNLESEHLNRRVIEAFTCDLLKKSATEINVAYVAVKASSDDDVVEDPESTRKLRLAIRRLRYHLAAMSALHGSLGAENLMQDLRVVGGPLGKLRDAETLERNVTRALGDRVDTEVGRELRQRATGARRLQQRALDDVILTDVVSNLLTSIETFRESFARTVFSQDAMRPLAQRALYESWHTLSRAAKKARRRDDDVHVHHTRIAAKHMLYLAQETSPLFHAPSSEFVLRLDDLQSYLGKQHDLVIVADWLDQVVDEDSSLRLMATLLTSRERQRAKKRRRRWTKRWKSVVALQEHKTWS